MKIIRMVVCIGLVVATFICIPVPSQATPNARMSLNTWVNHISPKCAALGFNLRSKDEYPKCKISDAELKVIRSADRVNSPDILTFQFDNIFALGVRFFAFILIYVLCFNISLNRKVLKKSICSLFLSAGIFICFFLIRAVIFGYIVVNNPVEYIGNFDNPIRIAMILFLALPLIVGIKKEENKEGEK